MYIHPEDVQAMEVCFLLTVNWMGLDYRFSTVPIDVKTKDGQVLRYNGGLSDPSIEQSTSLMGLNIEQDNISLELIFPGVNWIQEWLNGNSLSMADCVLAMIPMKEGYTSFTEEMKVNLFNGKVIDPIIGTPDRPIGHIIFSITGEVKIKKMNLISNSDIIDIYKYPGIDLNYGATYGEVFRTSIGKIVPFVFGNPGVVVQMTNLSGVQFIEKNAFLPVYFVGIATNYLEFVIGQGEMVADNVRIFQKNGGNFVNPIIFNQDTEGNMVSRVVWQGGSTIEDNLFNPFFDTDEEFYMSWGEYGDAMKDTFTGQSLGPGGNLILYFLDLLKVQYSRKKWMGLINVLNRYKFAGFINDPEVQVWEWLQENIIRYLPIEIFNGSEGLEPRLNLYYYTDEIHPVHYLEDNGLFEIITGLQPLDADVVNKVTVRFCYNGIQEQFMSSVSIDPTIEKPTSMVVSDPVAVLSYQRYGLKEQTLECPFIWDMDTAYRVARDIIRLKGLGVYGLEVQAAPQYGYLDVGQVIALTSENLGLKEHKCQIISKSWDDNQWRYVLHLEANPIVNPRLV